MPDDTIQFFDLEKAVEDFGIKMFEKNGKTRKQKRLRKKHFEQRVPCIEVQIDWSHLSVTHRTVWDDMVHVDFKPDAAGDAPTTSGKPADVVNSGANVMFKTDFKNDTEETQEYTLKIEKTTRSTLTTEIENGVTKGLELSATLSLWDAVEISAGYSRETSLTKMEGETQETELTWGVESNVTVPAGKSARATMEVVETQKKGNFNIFTTMTGYVKIKYIALKDNALLFSQSAKINSIVDFYKDEMKGKKFTFFGDGPKKSVTFKTSGTCQFRYGIQQKVTVVQEPASTGSPVKRK